MGRVDQSKDISIGEMKFTVQPLAPRAAMKCGLKLFKLIGAPAGALFGAVDLTKAKGQDNAAALTGAMSAAAGGAMAALTDRLDEDEVIDLIDELLVGCTVEKTCDDGKVHTLNLVGPTGVFDDVFLGDLISLFKVVGVALEVNFAGPLGGWRGLVARLMDLIKKGEEKAKA